MEEFGEDEMWGVDEHPGRPDESSEDENEGENEDDKTEGEEASDVTPGVTVPTPQRLPIHGDSQDASVAMYGSTWTAPISMTKGTRVPNSFGKPSSGHRRPSVPIAVPPAGENPGISQTGEDVEGFIPPHVLAASLDPTSLRTYASSAVAAVGCGSYGDPDGSSVVVGSGRTLKGRDAFRLRLSVLQQTGYVEPGTPLGTQPGTPVGTPPQYGFEPLSELSENTFKEQIPAAS
ncbi:hypothetical protein CYMTET_8533 [Cymbomonas tetramitiformis]|uniref:Uncharacterized protein n=1 Tax=Cymbomonas tetramitiformis TaxID=36881 RepID=A0AAE0LFZ8_9CHLO|nr:hypothetical protein CYMTET_8533 [Cymbomonas tetramitiformis]